MYIKKKLKALKDSRLLAGRFIYRTLLHSIHLGRLLTDAGYRSIHVAKWKFGGSYYQRSFCTSRDRYPVAFTECKTYLRTVEKPYILSFGCSTGEEVFTIGQYLPNANVMGVDINDWCIKRCKKKYPDPRFSFHNRISTAFSAAENFDAIFCMAVFQRTENRTNTDNSITKELTFEQFEQEIAILDRKLKPGGLLTIHHADFLFTDTAVSTKYTPLDFERNSVSKIKPLFDRTNKKVAEIQNYKMMFIKDAAQIK